MLWCRVNRGVKEYKGGVPNWAHAFFAPSDNAAAVQKAAGILQNGGIVAFPTETVYGLGADAFHADAVARVYRAKGRPGDNPLILHIDTIEAVSGLAASPSGTAMGLMTAFWPGPLTVVLQKSPALPPWVGGHPDGAMDTVAIRCPQHPAARELIRQSGCVVAAPSANKAGTPSPTCAHHVMTDFAPGEIDFLLDGGDVSGGLESTVVDVTGEIPCILRPGAVTADMIKEITGAVAYGENVTGAPRSPGQKYKHYAPKAPMTLFIGPPSGFVEMVNKKSNPAIKTGVLATAQTMALYQGHTNTVILNLGDRYNLAAIAHNLYGCLRRFDELGVEVIYAEAVPDEGLGRAIMNRMVKAAEGRIEHG